MIYITAPWSNCAVMQMFKTNLCYGLKQWVRQERHILMTATGVTVAVILLSLIGLLQASELAAFDQLFHLRLPEPIDQRVVIVELSENDIGLLWNWPIPDRVMAQLLQKLNTYQPRTIGLDIYRNLPVEPGQDEFVKACQTIPNLIGIEKLPDQMSRGVAAPPVLSQQKQVGFNNVVIDTDGKLRRSLLYWQEGATRQSLALKLALIYLQSEKITPKQAKNNSGYLQLAQTVLSRFQANDGGYVRADPLGYQVLVNFRRPGSFRTVSMTDVLENRVNSEWIRDRVVIIGSTAPSLQDFFYNPYSNHLLGSTATAISGVELNANFVSQILSSVLDKRPLIKTLPDAVEWLWTWIWSVLAAGVVWRLRSLRHSFLGLILIVIALLTIYYLAFYTGLWLPLIPPLLASFGAAVVIISYLAHLKEGLKRSKEFLQTVINTIPDPVFVKDKEHRCIILNQAYCQFVGYPLETLMEKLDYEIFSKQEADVFWAEDELVFETGQAQENEEELTDAFGITHLIATKKSLHQDASW